MSRIGIDVGGTNTDAVLLDGTRVLRAIKTPTTADVSSGVRKALAEVLAGDGPSPLIDAVVIGTTHFTNAVIERRGLQKVAALRIGLPAGASLPPFVDWPADLTGLVRGRVEMVPGGHEYDGRPLVPMNPAAVRDAARRIADAGLRSIAVSAVFSPLNPACEQEAERILREEIPGATITLSHELAGIGLLPRENAALLNACLQDLAATTTLAFTEALRQSGIEAPLYLTQNDGTIMNAQTARSFPVYCFASGPTNSMRGAAFLSGIDDAIVVDVGGTTTDVGHLRGGFPREANGDVEIGGVRTLFRMPDLLSVGLGGGSRVVPDAAGGEAAIGPQSVGYRLTEQALVFGGDVLTATDIAVAAGRIDLGDRGRLAHLPAGLAVRVMSQIGKRIAETFDRMKIEAAGIPLLAVGGGSILIPDQVEGASSVVRVPHHDVANAVGAAVAQASGETDQIFAGLTRDVALAQAQSQAEDRAVRSGARRGSLKVVDVEDIPLSYIPGNARRVRVRVVGDIDQVPAPCS